MNKAQLPSTSNIQHGIVALTASFLLVYVFYRGWNMSITFDEAVSYQEYAGHSFWEILTFDVKLKVPNNHIINSMLIKLSVALFGVEEWTLRIVNMLCFPITMWVSYKIFNPKVNWLGLAFWASIMGIPFLLDFFSLARGYGISLMFMCSSLYFLQQYFTKQGVKYLHFTLLLMALASISNFSFIYVYVPLVAFLGLNSLFEEKAFNKKLITDGLVLVLWSFILLAVCYEPLRILTEWNTIVGPKNGFWQSTLASLIIAFNYEVPPDAWLEFGQWVVTLTLLVTLGNLILLRKKASKFAWALLSIMCISILMQIIGNTFFDRHLLSFRIAIFFIPLYFFAIFYGLKEVSLKQAEPLKKFLIPILLLLTGFNLLDDANLTRTFEWSYDQDSKQAYEQIIQDSEQAEVAIALNWRFLPSFKFYREIDGSSKKVSLKSSDKSDQIDYFYLSPKEESKDFPHTDTMQVFPQTKNVLLKVKGQ